MRLLVANPNTSETMTEGLARTARAAAGPGVEILARTAPRGFPYISTLVEAQVSGVIAMEMIAAEADGIDAAVIAAFGDPGLKAAKQLFDMPIIGMAEIIQVAKRDLLNTFIQIPDTASMTHYSCSVSFALR